MSMFEAYLKETNKIKEEYAQSALCVKTFVILMGGEGYNFVFTLKRGTNISDTIQTYLVFFL